MNYLVGSLVIFVENGRTKRTPTATYVLLALTDTRVTCFCTSQEAADVELSLNKYVCKTVHSLTIHGSDTAVQQLAPSFPTPKMDYRSISIYR